MKLDTVNKKVSRGTTLETENFVIGDEAFILDIISSKMYSNPIRAICQEIMSNARDAHRELGNTDRAIQVAIPTNFDENYRVRDFGIGMTEDRVKTIYTKYGISTKRENNEQTGGFGIGSKTPMAYGDSFNVTSITPEIHFNGHENCNVKRTYIVHKNEKGIPVLAKISEVVTDEERGTEIVIPVAKADRSKFKEYSIATGKYWEVRPDFVGEEIVYEEDEKLYEGNDWYISGMSDYYNKNSSAIIDGIEYEIDVNNIETDNDKVSSVFDNVCIKMFFNTGELSMSATRETLDYSKKTCETICKIAEEIYDTLKNGLEDKIKQADNFYEANKLFHSDLSTWMVENKDIEWNGHKLLNRNVSLYSNYSFGEEGVLLYSCSENNWGGGDKPSRSKQTSVNFVNDFEIVYDTTTSKYPSYGRIKSYMEKEDIKNIYVIKYSEDDADAVKFLEDKLNWSELKKSLNKLDDYEPYKFTSSYGGGSRGSSQAIKAFKASGSIFKHADVDLKLDRGVYVEFSRNQVKINKSWQGAATLTQYVGALGLKNVYCIPTRFIKQLGKNWVLLDDIIKLKLEKAKVKYNNEYYDKVETKIDGCFYKHLDKIKEKANSKEFNILVDKVAEHEKLARKIRLLPYNIQSQIKSKGILENADKNVIEKYPMLAHIDINDWNKKEVKRAIDDIADYVKMVDNS